MVIRKHKSSAQNQFRPVTAAFHQGSLPLLDIFKETWMIFHCWLTEKLIFLTRSWDISCRVGADHSQNMMFS